MKKILALLCALSLIGCRDALSGRNDTTGPYINLTQYEFTTTVGHEIDFSNITAYDDVDGVIPVIVRGKVDYNTPGEYYLTLIAVDYSNNQTDVGITVYVTDAEYVEEVEETPTADEPKEKGCPTGKNKLLDCETVLHKDVSKYETIYYGEEGKQRCEDRVVEMYSTCEVIYRNDNQVWGYGYRKLEGEEKN